VSATTGFVEKGSKAGFCETEHDKLFDATGCKKLDLCDLRWYPFCAQSFENGGTKNKVSFPCNRRDSFCLVQDSNEWYRFRLSWSPGTAATGGS